MGWTYCEMDSERMLEILRRAIQQYEYELLRNGSREVRAHLKEIVLENLAISRDEYHEIMA